MTDTMFVSGQPVAIGAVSMVLCRFANDGGTDNFLDISSESSNPEIGGMAINGLSVGSISTLEQLSGRTLSFDSNIDADNELAESVFWLNANDTLEIEKLSIVFGALTQNTMQISLQASCFTYAPHKDIPVVIVAVANIISY